MFRFVLRKREKKINRILKSEMKDNWELKIKNEGETYWFLISVGLHDDFRLVQDFAGLKRRNEDETLREMKWRVKTRLKWRRESREMKERTYNQFFGHALNGLAGVTKSYTGDLSRAFACFKSNRGEESNSATNWAFDEARNRCLSRLHLIGLLTRLQLLGLRPSIECSRAFSLITSV